jgi:hypothetical protein
MHMRNHYIFLIIGLLAAHVGHGQISLRVISMDTLVSEVRPADFHPMSPVVDSNANVVVLRDSGSADLEGGFVGWQVSQTRYRRLLIRNKNGFDAAKVNLSYDLAINLFGIRFQGYTCNLVGDSVVKTVIDTSEIPMLKRVRSSNTAIRSFRIRSILSIPGLSRENILV